MKTNTKTLLIIFTGAVAGMAIDTALYPQPLTPGQMFETVLASSSIALRLREMLNGQSGVTLPRI